MCNLDLKKFSWKNKKELGESWSLDREKLNKWAYEKVKSVALTKNFTMIVGKATTTIKKSPWLKRVIEKFRLVEKKVPIGIKKSSP